MRCSAAMPQRLSQGCRALVSSSVIGRRLPDRLSLLGSNCGKYLDQEKPNRGDPTQG